MELGSINKAGFRNHLFFELKEGSDIIHILFYPLVYYSVILGRFITINSGFYTDLASVPRIPFIYNLWGNRAHREAILHDYLYRKDSDPIVSYSMANRIFLEAMESRGVKPWIRNPMYWGVCLGGFTSYHRRNVGDIL